MLKTKNNKKIIIITLVIILVCAFAFSGTTAFAEEVPEVSPSSPPLMQDDIGGIFAGLLKSITDFFYTILGTIAMFVLWIVDSMFALIDVFAGVTEEGEQNILVTLFQNKDISAALFGITALGSVLVLFVGVFSVFRRSTSDKHGSMGSAVKNIFKAIALFILVPMLCIAIIFVVNLLVGGIKLAISGGEMKSFGEMLFRAGYKVGENPVLTKFFQIDINNFDMYKLDGLIKAIDIKGFQISDPDWLLIIVGGVALVWFCFPMIISLVSRLFELVIMYVFDAIPIAFMPYDDGERFNQWKDDFISTFMSAYGIVLSYSLFGMLMEPLTELVKDVSFLKIIIILGGAFFMNKAPQIITRLLGLKGGGGQLEQSLGQGLRHSLSAGVKVAGGAALVAGGFALSKGAKAAGGIKNRIAPTGGARAEKILNRQDKLEARSQKLETKRQKAEGGSGSSGGSSSGTSVRGNYGAGTSYKKSPRVPSSAGKANDGYIPLKTGFAEKQNKMPRQASVAKKTEKIQRRQGIQSPQRNVSKIDKKIQRNNAQLAKNRGRVASIKREVERNQQISGTDYRRNWEKAQNKRHDI